MSHQNFTGLSIVNSNDLDENRLGRTIAPKMHSSQAPLAGSVNWTEPDGVFFGYAAYLQSLRNLQDHRSKRSMLKNKDILFKDK